MDLASATRGLGRGLNRLGALAVRRGIPTAWLGYRWVQTETVDDYCSRQPASRPIPREVIHVECVEQNPLPRNVQTRSQLPNDRGWWGYSFYDVPARRSGETWLATLPDCTIVPYLDPNGEFWVGILNAEHRALSLREFHFRRGHARVHRASKQRPVLERATWITERVFDNYSHWFTAHLPKLLLLQARDALGQVVLPASRPRFVDDSMRLAGIDPDAFATFDPTRSLKVRELTLLGTDRFRPELLRLARERYPALTDRAPFRRIFVSRKHAARRRLINETAIWPLLRREGFESVVMEKLSFVEQVRLMQETAVLLAPHGAGLTNAMFCPTGTQIVELADLGFPNPNFYAVSAAMGHDYWLLPARALGDGHALHKDLWIDPATLASVLPRLSAQEPCYTA